MALDILHLAQGADTAQDIICHAARGKIRLLFRIFIDNIFYHPAAKVFNGILEQVAGNRARYPSNQAAAPPRQAARLGVRLR